MDNDYILTQDGELVHWGIIGMKWGQRRYQNKDGSLTPAGRKRLKAESDKLKEREAVIKNKERVKARNDKLKAKKDELDARQKALDDAAKAEKAAKKGGKGKNATTAEKPKSIKDMTDDELFRAVNRARLESELQRLRPEQTQMVKPNPKFLTKFVDDAIKPAFISGGRTFLEGAIKKIGDKALGNDKGKEVDYGEMSKKYEALEKKRKYENAIAKDKEKKSDNSVSAPDSGTKPTVIYSGSTATRKTLPSLSNRKVSSVNTSSPFGKDYEKRVDKILSEMDDKGWDLYESQYKRG